MSAAPVAADRRGDAVGRVTREFSAGLWRDSRLATAERFNTWPLVAGLLDGGERLEIGPGLRPRLPLAGSRFADASLVAVRRLREAGASAVVADASRLPFAAGRFSLVCAFDVVEHVADDHAVLAELARVLAPGGRLLVSVPLHDGRWTPFDEMVGHYRRYEPDRLLDALAAHGLEVESSAAFGMQPKSGWLLAFGMWMIRRFRRLAMRWYNGILLPIGLRFQRPLRMAPGFVDPADVDEVVAVCRAR